jgi:hypothetical protein
MKYMKIWHLQQGKYVYSSIEITEALRLYEGGLYKVLQQELREIHESIVNRKEELKEITALTKKFDQLGIKPLKAGEKIPDYLEPEPTEIHEMYEYGPKGKR